MKKIMKMDWNQIEHDRGLKWERIQSVKTGKGRAPHTIRQSKKHRAVYIVKGIYDLCLPPLQIMTRL